MSASIAMLALRIWWPIVVVLSLVGAAGGYVATRDAPYVAVTTLRVDTAGFGEVAQASIVETSRLLVDSNRTYRKVVGDAPGAIDELRSRTAVDAIGSSSVLELAVSAQTAEQAEREVEALAEASITSVRELADEQFTGTVRNGENGIAIGRLADPAAEQARRDALGVAVAAQQDLALRLSGSLSRIGEVPPATRIGLGQRLGVLIGLLVGAVAGGAFALFLGVGRRRIHSLADMKRVSPAPVDCEPLPREEGIGRIAAAASRMSYPLVAVLALPGAEADVRTVADELADELRSDGNRPHRMGPGELRHAEGSAAAAPTVDRSGGPDGTAPRAVPLGMPNRARALAAANSELLIVTADADPRTLRQLAGRADVVLLVARRRRTRLRELTRVVEHLRADVPPLVVLAVGRPAAAEEPAPSDAPAPHHPAAWTAAPAGPRPEPDAVPEPDEPGSEAHDAPVNGVNGSVPRDGGAGPEPEPATPEPATPEPATPEPAPEPADRTEPREAQPSSARTDAQEVLSSSARTGDGDG